jgi:hypothetical protein
MNLAILWLLLFGVGLTSTLAQGFRDQISPFKMAAGLEFTNLRVARQSPDKTEVVMAFEYRYDGSAGASAQIAFAIEKRDQKGVSSWFGAEPLVIGVGRGPLSVKVKYFSDEKGVPPEFTTDRVRLLLLNTSGTSILTSTVFLRTIHWGKPGASPTPAKTPPAIAPMGELKTAEKAYQEAQPEAARRAADLAAAQAEADKLRKEKQVAQEKADAEAAERAKAMATAQAEAQAIAEQKRQAEEKARQEEQARIQAKERAEALAHQEAVAKAKADAEERELARVRAEARLKELLQENELARKKAQAEAEAREAARLQAEAKTAQLTADKQSAELKTAAMAEAASLKTKIANIEVVKRSLDRTQMVLGIEFEYQDHLNSPLLGVMVARSEDPQSSQLFVSKPVEIGHSNRSFSLLPVEFQPAAANASSRSPYTTDQVMVYLQEANSPKRYVLLTAAKQLVWGTPTN